MNLAALLCSVALAGGPQVEGDRLMQTLRELPITRAAMGAKEDIEGLAHTEEFVIKRLEDLGYKPATEDIEWAMPVRSWAGKDHVPRKWRNVIAEKTGTKVPEEVIVVSAHLDTVVGTPGADDDGTGVAALLELARVLRDEPLARTVRLAFFNLEEVGLAGSRQHVTARAGAKERVLGMMSLEMLGYFTDEPGSQRTPIPEIPGVFKPSTVGDFISIVGIKAHQAFSARLEAEMLKAAPGLKTARVDFLPIPAPDLLRSDHAPFLAAGLPAVMITDTANFRNPNYHKPGDTVETIDAQRFTLVVQALAGAVRAIAEPALDGAASAGEGERAGEGKPAQKPAEK